MTSFINHDCFINGVQYKCRTCFDPGRIIHSLAEEASTTKTWHQVLEDIAQLQTKDDELLPKTLCCDCLDKLKRSYEFILQVQTVNKKYSELLIKEGGSNEVDNSTDCLAESTIALPLDIKLEEEMVVSYDINMSNNLEEGDETNFENQDYDDPFNETIDEDYKEENESSPSSNEAEGEIDCSSSSKKNINVEFPSSKSVKQLTRGQPCPQDDVIEKINDNCFLCLLCKKTLTLLRNCRRHVATLHYQVVKTPSKKIGVKKYLHQTPKDGIDVEHVINTNDSNLLFGERLYSKPTGWRVVECKLCSITFKTCKTLRQHLEHHTDIDTLHNLKLSDNVVQHLFPNMNDLNLIKENICKDIRNKHWFKYYTVVNEHFYEMSVSDTEVEELAEEHAERSNKYKCAFCATEFAYKYQVYPHLKQAHSKREIPFKCTRCKLEFVSIKMYKQHLQTHCNNKDKSFPCGNCPGKFTWVENLKNHNCIKGITSTTPANFEDQHKDIQNDITRDPSDSASVSSTAIADGINKKNFQDVHFSGTDLDKTPAPSIEAMQDINIFESISDLDSALESISKLTDCKQPTQEAEGKLACSFCSVSFSDNLKLSAHTRTCHVNETTFKCGVCEKEFVGATDLESHRLIHPVENPFKCMFCEKSFEHRTQFLRHKHAHTREKTLCPVCGIHLSKNSSFSEHLLTHTDDKPYKCEFCDKSFIRKSYMLNHRRTHTAERPFKCPHCEKAFPRRERLRNHIRIHTGERPYQCTYCNKAFIISERLKLHLRCHTGEKPFRCEVCGQAYACRPYLKKHRIAKGHFIENE